MEEQDTLKLVILNNASNRNEAVLVVKVRWWLQDREMEKEKRETATGQSDLLEWWGPRGLKGYAETRNPLVQAGPLVHGCVCVFDGKFVLVLKREI